VAEPEVGVIYTGKVVKTVEFGAFVNFLGAARRPRAHLGTGAASRRQGHGRVVKEGDQVKVKVLGIDDRGKVRLSMKVVDQEDRRKDLGGSKPS
jgi:polyribonucleotide nucleotidyltransferase